jgi:DNA-binding CsgD family transcriptional regulator
MATTTWWGGRAAACLAGVDDYGNRYCTDDCPIVSIATRGDSVRQFRIRAKTKGGEKVALEVSVLKFMLREGNGMLLLHTVRPAEAAEEAPAAHKEAPDDPRLRELTAREIEVLGLLASGEKTRAIAGRLGIAPLTARNHINNMFEKLDVHSKAEAIALAYRMHVV